MDYFKSSILRDKKINFILNTNLVKKVVNKKLTFLQFVHALRYEDSFPGSHIHKKQIEYINWLEKWSLGNKKMMLGTRGMGKSDIGAVLYPLYLFYLNPKTTCTITTSTKDLAKQRLEAIGKYIVEHCELFNLTKKQAIRGITKEKINFYTKADGGKSPNFSVSSLNTEKQGSRVDFIIMDDVLTYEKRFTENQREKANVLYRQNNSLLGRAVANDTGKLLIIGNLTHPNDLYNDLRSEIAVDKLEIWNDDLPEGFKKTEAQLLIESKNDLHYLNANYKGVLIKTSNNPLIELDIVIYNNTQEFMDSIKKYLKDVVLFFDPSYKGKDYSALSCVFHLEIKGKEYIFSLGLAEQLSYSDFLEKYLPILSSYQLNEFVFIYEDNGGVVMEAERILQKNNFFNYLGKTTKLNKQAKIGKLYPITEIIKLVKIKDDSILTANFKFIEQVVGYSPNSNANDDAPDSLAMAINELGFFNYYIKNKKNVL